MTELRVAHAVHLCHTLAPFLKAGVFWFEAGQPFSPGLGREWRNW